VKKIYLLVILLVLILAGGFFVNKKIQRKEPENQTTISQNHTANSETREQEPEAVEQTLPSSYKIENVPFQPQAPFANWDELHDEACEEASLVIAKYYLDGKSLSAEEMDQEILGQVSWEVKNWGSHKDLTAQETVELGESFYGLNGLEAKIINSIDEIKKEIAQNHPVIVPAAGRLLGNPYYRQPGPVYHMLVVTGYNEKEIITNDIGTKRGENFEYANSIFYNAIHDWAGLSENIENGQKVMIVIK